MFSLRKLSLACLCALLVAIVCTSAQTTADGSGRESVAPGVLKLGAYGDVNCEDVKARLDSLSFFLHEDREAEGYVIVYGGRVKVSRKVLSHIDFTKGYLIHQREHEARLIHVIYGGQREDFTVELFVVRKGAAPPKPAPTVEAPDDPRAPRKFDEGRYGFERDARGRPVLWGDDPESCPFELPDLAEYAKALRAEPDSKAHVIVYGERGRRLSDSNTISRLVRHRLFNVERIPHRRITVVYGGTRYRQSVELWIVPRGVRPPAPTRD